MAPTLPRCCRRQREPSAQPGEPPTGKDPSGKAFARSGAGSRLGEFDEEGGGGFRLCLRCCCRRGQRCPEPPPVGSPEQPHDRDTPPLGSEDVPLRSAGHSAASASTSAPTPGGRSVPQGITAEEDRDPRHSGRTHHGQSFSSEYASARSVSFAQSSVPRMSIASQVSAVARAAAAAGVASAEPSPFSSEGGSAAASAEAAEGQAADLASFQTCNWAVGARHELLRSATLWGSNCGPQGGASFRLEAGCSVLLVRMEQGTDGRPMGLVVAGQLGESGWLALEESGAEAAAGARSRLLGEPVRVWQLQESFRTRAVLALRSSIALSSNQIRELPVGEVAVLLELDLSPGFARAGGNPRARLRARVRTASGEEGWLSPETAEGQPLLELSEHGAPDGGLPKDVVMACSSDEEAELARGRSGTRLSASSSADGLTTACYNNTPSTGGSTGQPSPTDLMPRFNNALTPSPHDRGRGSSATSSGGVEASPLPASSSHSQQSMKQQFVFRDAELYKAPQEEEDIDDDVQSLCFEATSPTNEVIESNGCQCERRRMPRTSMGPSSLQDEPAPRGNELDTNSALGCWMRGVYARYNPKKLHRVPDLLAEFVGREQELVDFVAHKYHLKPLPAELLRQT